MELFNKQAHLLVSSNGMLKKARKEGYAIGQFNINDLETTKAILEVAQETITPIILGVSQGAIKYMGGYNAVYGMVIGLMRDLNITVPVALHLDHCKSLTTIKRAINAGFTSIMYDGSSYEFEDNYKDVLILIEYIKNTIKDRDISLEIEIGKIGGKEYLSDKIIEPEIANIEECIKMNRIKDITMIAVGIGNIHGKYPKDFWQKNSLRFDILQEIGKNIKKSLVLHGGSGIPKEEIQEAIKLGITKVNINTDCQIAFAKALRKYFVEKRDLDSKNNGYDIRKILKPGYEAIKQKVIELIKIFGSLGKAEI